MTCDSFGDELQQLRTVSELSPSLARYSFFETRKEEPRRVLREMNPIKTLEECKLPVVEKNQEHEQVEVPKAKAHVPPQAQ